MLLGERVPVNSWGPSKPAQSSRFEVGESWVHVWRCAQASSGAEAGREEVRAEQDQRQGLLSHQLLYACT